MNPRNINRHQSLDRRVSEREVRRRRKEMTEMRNDGDRGRKRCLHLRNTDDSFYHCRETRCPLNVSSSGAARKAKVTGESNLDRSDRFVEFGIRCPVLLR